MRIPLPSVKRRARIEIIPLIDIVFFLLATFVMVSLSMTKNEGIAVRLPIAKTGTTQENHPLTTIAVTEYGDVYLNKEKILMGELPGRLSKIKSENPEVRVFVRGDEAAPFGEAIRVLDEVRKAGIVKVAVQTRSEETGASGGASTR